MISELQYRILVPLLAVRLQAGIDGTIAAAYVGQRAATRMPTATRVETIARWMIDEVLRQPTPARFIYVVRAADDQQGGIASLVDLATRLEANPALWKPLDGTRLDWTFDADPLAAGGGQPFMDHPKPTMSTERPSHRTPSALGDVGLANGPLAVSRFLAAQWPVLTDPLREVIDQYEEFEEVHFPIREDFVGFSPGRWRHCFDAFEKYFGIVIRDEAGAIVSSPIATFGQRVLTNAVENALLIGDKGVGKTTFLLSLYLYWKEQFLRCRASTGEQGVMPFFIRLGALESWKGGRFDKPTTDNAIEATAESIDEIVGQLGPNRIIVMVDGVSQTGDHRLLMAANLVRALRERTADVQFVISADHMRDVQALAKEEVISFRQSLLRFHSLPIDDMHLPDLVVQFCALSGVQDTQSLIAQLREKEVPNVDLFILMQFGIRFRAVEYRDLRSLAECYSLLCGRELADATSSRGRTTAALLAAAARTAFRILIMREERLSDIDDEAVARLLSRHISVTHFLIAKYLVDMILHSSKDAAVMKRHLNYVFPAQVNSFIKQLMKADDSIEDGILKVISKRYSKLETLGKSQCCYLAGRVTARYRSSMLDFLDREYRAVASRFDRTKKSRENIPADMRAMRDLRMLRRCILISRSMLGDDRADKLYADMLLKDKEENQFNRGFHLEYYGDIEFHPDGRMSSRDDGKASCQLTIMKLMRRLIEPKDRKLPLIELITVLSLAQARHQRGELDDDVRHSLVEFLNTIPSETLGRLDQIVRAYVNRMNTDLRRERLNLSELMGEWYRLKRVERTGWMERRARAHDEGRSGWQETRIESVAEHSFFTVLAAIQLLDKPAIQAESFDKEHVLRMLFVHDLGEARVGDQIKQDTVREIAALYDYAAFGTYEGIANLWGLPDLYREFTHGTTAEAKIARDMDRLEFILQGRLYAAALTEEELRECEAEIERFETDTVRRVLDLMKGFPGDDTGVGPHRSMAKQAT